MGKGDKKTRRGKIVRGSFGVRRRRKGKTIAQIIKEKEKASPVKKVVEIIQTEEKPVPKKPAVKKAEPEKKPAKKPVAKAAKKPTEKKE